MNKIKTLLHQVELFDRTLAEELEKEIKRSIVEVESLQKIISELSRKKEKPTPERRGLGSASGLDHEQVSYLLRKFSDYEPSLRELEDELERFNQGQVEEEIPEEERPFEELTSMERLRRTRRNREAQRPVEPGRGQSLTEQYENLRLEALTRARILRRPSEISLLVDQLGAPSSLGLLQRREHTDSNLERILAWVEENLSGDDLGGVEFFRMSVELILSQRYEEEAYE